MPPPTAPTHRTTTVTRTAPIFAAGAIMLEALSDPALRAIYAPGLIAGVLIALVCGLVSPLVVVRRMGFIGQGISHSAFGGIGVAALLAAWSAGSAAGFLASGGLGEFLIIMTFCALAAVGMGALGSADAPQGSGPAAGASRGSGAGSEDTAIGIYLVGSMALGAVLVQLARDYALAAGRPADVRSWESILFGSVLLAGRFELALAWGSLAVVGITLWLLRRPLVLWAADEGGAAALGVPVRALRAAVGILLAGVVVASMKVAGVVLASALLILPGATALNLADRLVPTLLGSCVSALVAMVLGLALAIEFSLPPGPSIVGVLIALFAASSLLARAR
ncbi:MAG: metal ABC transporter permease [Phycisphaerales bacterium]